MGDFDRVIGELASRRDALGYTIGDLGGWRRLRSDVFAAVLDTRRTLVDQQRLFLAAIADGHSVARGLTAETLSACRALRGLLAEVDAAILRLMDV